MDTMRQLFARQNLRGQLISLRHALETHVGLPAPTLRKALTTFTQLHTSSGFESGCREPDDIELGVEILGVGGGRNLGGLFPSWTAVRFNPRRSRTLEGVLVKSKITKEDFPLKPWHTFYDWNFFVRVDRQFRYLLNEITRKHHSEGLFGSNLPPNDVQDIIECERDTAFLPLWAIPQVGSRVSLTGRWIFDCGHPEDGQHRMEIHPPKAVISFRNEATSLPGNSGPTRVNQAVVFIGRKGGYIDLPINDQNYAFDLPLPPKPHPGATPVFHARGVTGMEREEAATLPVQPVITPFPAHTPTLFRVAIPLKGVAPEPETYGAIISAGWTDPEGTQSQDVRRLRVSLRRLEKLGPGAPVEGISKLEWLFYFGVNGRWHKVDLTQPVTQMNLAATLDLHKDDRVHLTACGFAKLQIHQFMGRNSGVEPRLTSERRPIDEVKNAGGKVRSAFFDLDDIPGSFSNIGLNLFSRRHGPEPGRFVRVDSKDHPGPLERGSRDHNYQMDYEIELL